VNAADFSPGIAQNTWISIVGANLAATTRSWKSSDIVDGELPTSLDGVSVTVNGKPAYVSYVSPVQLNVLTPVDSTLGPVTIVIANNGLVSAQLSVSLMPTAPAFFRLKDPKYIAALHADNTIVGPVGSYPNASPAKPGETIVLYANGFGPPTTAIPAGQVITTPLAIAKPTVQIASTFTQVMAAALTAPGLYQLNVVVPDTAPDGDAPVLVQVGSVMTSTGTYIPVQK